jgi:hypothetical protein
VGSPIAIFADETLFCTSKHLRDRSDFWINQLGEASKSDTTMMGGADRLSRHYKAKDHDIRLFETLEMEDIAYT